MGKICLDTGVLSILFSEDCTEEVRELMNAIKNGTYEASIVKPALCEVFFHLCRAKGRETATALLTSFLRKYPIVQLELNESLIYFTGLLKCQHRDTLSYIDCMSIAYCLQNHVTFHTTEKVLNKIPHNTLQRLNIVKYQFSP